MVRRTFRKCFDRRALTPVISSIIMASVVIALSFAVLAWSQFRTSEYTDTYGETTDAAIARLKERLTVEYISYNGSSGNLSIYLLNCGAINNVEIESVRVQNATGHIIEVFSDTELDLDMGAKGFLILNCEEQLDEGNYFVSIETERRSLFNAGFDVA
ncbi:MAG: hypothetical protein IBV52_09005 [Candidatus Bathyarchaeota archaeon]